MQDIDMTTAARFTRQLFPHADFNTGFTFVYDETNNIRKFQMIEGNFNNDFNSNFVLGGFAYKGSRPDTARIFDNVRLQANIKEVKFAHIANGGFLDVLKSRKLTTFLENILKTDLYLHFSSLNILYYSLVDIVDSSFSENGSLQYDMGLNRFLKNALYEISRKEIDKITALFYKYKYPNLQKEELVNFVAELLAIFQPYESDREFGMPLLILKKELINASSAGRLPFIMDDTSHVLIAALTSFYHRPVYLFSTSGHLFDNEEEIKADMAKLRFIVEDKVLNNYSFLDSKNDILVQACDVIVGFVGKMSKFINLNSKDMIKEEFGKFTPVQGKNLDLYLKLVLKSEKLNPAFFHYVESDENHSKFDYILGLRNI